MIRHRIGISILSISGGVLLCCIIGMTVFREETLDYRVYRVEQGWGYDIVCQGRRVIHQPYVPALPGHWPFPSRRSAVNTARAVLSKIGRGEFPTLTFVEIDSLLMAGK